MTGLETKLNLILTEKNSKIIPENIKKNVQIFDVTGTYEGGGTDLITLSDINEQIKDSIDYINDYSDAIVDSYTALSNEAVTLYTPDINFQYYLIQKRSSGKYRIVWANTVRMIDDTGIRPIDISLTSSTSANDFINVNFGLTINSGKTGPVYYSSEYDSIEICINNIKNSETTYSYNSNTFLAYSPDTPVKIPIANVAIYYYQLNQSFDVINDGFIMPSKISSNETIAAIS